jgi:hypothetical protein
MMPDMGKQSEQQMKPRRKFLDNWSRYKPYLHLIATAAPLFHIALSPILCVSDHPTL